MLGIEIGMRLLPGGNSEVQVEDTSTPDFDNPLRSCRVLVTGLDFEVENSGFTAFTRDFNPSKGEVFPGFVVFRSFIVAVFGLSVERSINTCFWVSFALE